MRRMPCRSDRIFGFDAISKEKHSISIAPGQASMESLALTGQNAGVMGDDALLPRSRLVMQTSCRRAAGDWALLYRTSPFLPHRYISADAKTAVAEGARHASSAKRSVKLEEARRKFRRARQSKWTVARFAVIRATFQGAVSSFSP